MAFLGEMGAMSNRPQRLVLIHAGRYDYSEVELTGTLQIVGPNNTGKTTLINILQFLYVDDRRHMDFGSYTPEQTRDYYFPNQYSYVLFEVLGTRGICVMGWRGQSRAAGGEPDRFYFEGPFDPTDFLDGNNQVREPKDVNARLAVKQYRSIKNAQEHRELLLLPTKGESRGIGLVALRDNDRYASFRETLKNLLSLSTISQDQMREQLLMLADVSRDRYALDVRELFNEEYDRLVEGKQKLLRFKKYQAIIEMLIQTNAQRDVVRTEQIGRWRDLQEKRVIFEKNHWDSQNLLAMEAETAANRAQELVMSIDALQHEKEGLAEKKGELLAQIRHIRSEEEEFHGFLEDWHRNALANLERDFRELEDRLRDADREPLSKAQQRLERCRELVTQHQRSIELFHQLLITALRQGLTNEELISLSRLFTFEILEQPIGENGASILRQNEFTSVLRSIAECIEHDIYRDKNIEVPLPLPRRDLSELEDVQSLRERLAEHEQALTNCENVVSAIIARESLAENLSLKKKQIDDLREKLVRFNQYEKIRADESRVNAELKRIEKEGQNKEKLIVAHKEELKRVEGEQRHAQDRAKDQERDFRAQIKTFNDCPPPQFNAEPIPQPLEYGFPTLVEQYLNAQNAIGELDHTVDNYLRELERHLGPDYSAADQSVTIRLLREEAEALPDREEVLRRAWTHQLTDMQATFDAVLRSLEDIKSAADRLNREFAAIQISNLSSLRMEVMEQTEIVASIRMLSKAEQPGLFEESAVLESTVTAFRRKFESNPLLRYVDLFTLRFTVTGDDSSRHHYHDFRQVESHGTTITIKVLFNLLVLRFLLREDSQRNLLCELPFFLDEIHSLDCVNRNAILTTARKLGFIAITAAPEAVSEVETLYFLRPQLGRIVLRHPHKMRVMARQRGV